MKDNPRNSTNHVTVTIPGPAKEQSSYRGELGGILAGIAITNRLLKKYNIKKGKCRFAGDNKGAIAASFGWKTPTPDWSCFDLISLIRQQIRNSQWIGEHVKGYQDEEKTFENLDCTSQANTIADDLAKKELSMNN